MNISDKTLKFMVIWSPIPLFFVSVSWMALCWFLLGAMFPQILNLIPFKWQIAIAIGVEVYIQICNILDFVPLKVFEAPCCHNGNVVTYTKYSNIHYAPWMTVRQIGGVSFREFGRFFGYRRLIVFGKCPKCGEIKAKCPYCGCIMSEEKARSEECPNCKKKFYAYV